MEGQSNQTFLSLNLISESLHCIFLRMTPLGASLIFVFISVLVSLFRHIFFHSSSLNANDDSNISLIKLHTLTTNQNSPQKRPYNSLYEAYFKPEPLKPLQPPLPYNSYALKKAILNNEGVYLCDEKFAAIFEEKTICDGSDSDCKWKTIITVYKLPLLKKQQSKVLEVDGKILATRNNENQLTCRKRQLRLWEINYQLNFVVIFNGKDAKKGAGWSMNSLIIEEERNGHWRREGGPFSLKLVKWNLKNVNHYPELYSFDQKCLSYITAEQPWLIHYNCANNWTTINILHPQIQKQLFSNTNSTFSPPPFSPTYHVQPFFMHLFKSTFKTYTKQSCAGAICPKLQHKLDRHFITYVFEVMNSPLRYGKSIIQITLALNEQADDKSRKLVSHRILLSDMQPERKYYVDCNIHSKEYKLIKGLYTYQLGFGQDNVVASLQKHSLICICAMNYNQNLNVIQIEDVLSHFNTTQLPHQIIIRSKEVLEQKKLENHIFRRENLLKKKEEQQQLQESNGWFDFDFFNFKYNYQESHEKQVVPLEQIEEEIPEIKEQQPDTEIDKKEKKPKQKKQEKKRNNKKGRKQNRRQDEGKNFSRFTDDPIGEKIQEIADSFADLGYGSSTVSQEKMIIIPMPFTLTKESKFKIVNGDLQFPLIYLETAKRYLMTYHINEQDDNPPKNETFKKAYSYKYAQIGTDVKSPQNYIAPFPNETQQKANPKRKEFDEIQVDRFLMEVVQYNPDVMNFVKAVSVVDARYDGEGIKQTRLKGLAKPNRKQVIVAWGWGIEVYQINWDKKGFKAQLLQIEQQLNMHQEGIEMAALLPFIQLFATVYCLFQSLITSR